MTNNMPLRIEYQVISTEHGQTGYVTLGSGKPLIMLVGYSGNLLHWNSQLIYELATQYLVYCIDNRNVGISDSTNPDTMEGLAADVLDFIEALNLDQPLLCGWSMGGIIAQAVAYVAADKISGMILLASQPDYSYTLGKLHELVRNLRENPGQENREKLMELFFSTPPTLEFRKYLAHTILPIAHYVYPFNESAQAIQDTAVKNWQQDPAKLTAIKLATLIVTARNDKVTEPRASWYLHECLENSKLISYPTGGHFFLQHYPLSLAQEIINFFMNETPE